MCFSSKARVVLLWVTCFFAAGVACAATEPSAAKQDAASTVYKPGPDVKAPKLVHYVEPEFSSSSKEAFVDGVVKISTVVTTDGVPTDLHILSGLNTKEDDTAMDAVKQWRFQPGTKHGEAVKVQVTVEVIFQLL